MAWDVEVTDECRTWLEALDEADFDAVDFAVDLLIERGPQLEYPHSSKINGRGTLTCASCESNRAADHYVFSNAFDPRRHAILLTGGDKTADKRFYDRMIPIADDLYDVHLGELRREGLLP